MLTAWILLAVGVILMLTAKTRRKKGGRKIEVRHWVGRSRTPLGREIGNPPAAGGDAGYASHLLLRPRLTPAAVPAVSGLFPKAAVLRSGSCARGPMIAGHTIVLARPRGGVAAIASRVSARGPGTPVWSSGRREGPSGLEASDGRHPVIGRSQPERSRPKRAPDPSFTKWAQASAGTLPPPTGPDGSAPTHRRRRAVPLPRSRVALP